MRGDVIVVAVGLVVALAFSNLVKAFTDNIINPLIAAVPAISALAWDGNSLRAAARAPYLGDHLLHCLYGCGLFPDRAALQGRDGPTGQGRLW
jgi:hypothetical protein